MTAVSHHGVRLAKLGLIAAMVSRVFGRLIGIVLVVVLAREAAPDTVAVYGYLLSTATLVVTLTDLGVASVAGREVAAGRMPTGGALYASLLPHAASLLAAAVVTVVLTESAGPNGVSAAALILTVLFVIVGGLVNLWAELLRATGRVMLEGALQIGSATALALGGVLVIGSGGGATALLVIVVLKEAVVLVVLLVLIQPRRDPEIRSRRMLGQSLWLAVAGTALILLWRQGTLVVGATGSILALSTYVVASRFLDAGVTIAHTAGFGLLPGMSALADEPSAFRQAARRYLALAALVSGAVAVIGFFSAHAITVVPFGERWVDAVPAVRVFAISSIPILISYVALPFLLARRQVRVLAAGSLSGAAVGLGVSVGLAWWKATAWSAPAGTAIGAVVMALFFLHGLRDLLAGPGDSTAGSSTSTEGIDTANGAARELVGE